jgi:hypothetical protein
LDLPSQSSRPVFIAASNHDTVAGCLNVDRPAAVVDQDQAPA